MNRKNLSIGLIVLLLAGVIYYFTTGSTQLTAKMTKQVNTELTSLQNEGFSVKDREIKKTQEHFILSFDEPQKIAQFLTRQGLQLNADDAEMLKGLQVGVDVQYLTDAYSAVSFDMYPLTLPTVLTTSALNEAEKKTLIQIENMLKKKTFLMHIAINKLGTGFKGNMKDITEILHGEKDVNLSIEGLNFFGNIKDDSLHSLTQELNQLTIHVSNELKVTFTGLKSDYLVTGKTVYDYATEYSIDTIHISAPSEFDFEADALSMYSDSSVKDGLASGSITTQAKSVKFLAKSKPYTLDTLDFEMKVTNLDVTAFENLKQANVSNEQEMNMLLHTLISKGVHFEIPTFSVANILDAQNNAIGGFKLNAKVDIDKSLNISTLQMNPTAALSAIDATLNFHFSNALFTLISQQPQAMMALMLFPPKDVNGTKVYELELKDGKSTVNGMSLL